MKRVLIVEDDKFFRFAMKKTIRWAENDLELAGEAVHGGAALEFLEKEQVNIVLTDMNMPIMNGVKLTEEIKKKYPHIMVAALSAYDDFELVKEAMKLGASDYLLKQDMEEQDIGKKIADTWKTYVKELTEKVWIHEGIMEFLKGGNAEASLWMGEYLRDCLEIEKGIFICLLRTPGKGWKTEFLELKESIMQIRHGQEWIFFLREPEHLSERKKIEEKTLLTSEIQSLVEGEACVGACSRTVRKVEQLGSVWKEVRERLECASFSGRTGILMPGEEPKERTLHWEYVPGEKMDRITCEQALAELHSLTETMRKVMPDAEHVRRSFLRFLEAVLQAGHFKTAAFDHMEVYQQLCGTFTLNEKEQLVESYIQELFEQKKKSGYSDAVQSGISFIESNYMNAVSLKDVAEGAAMNETYFSNLFKREVGMGVIDYLNHTRIEAAKELLEQTSLKNYEIGERVGIFNASYFSTLFRKETGMTIQEYRKKYK